ncbi:YgjV family protein [Paludibaculum fermentans]|uniref:YgjV family protein n=1 Tax=Paludibaculum fermentans TaxID=1473598 RepID=A0A7S7NU68_PALFE|nr:YgjV family protein [Paludibaculum fermentans]QOY89897.1 YgjV family protein [Paludibaculum fermentans]
MQGVDLLGYVATGTFAASYFLKGPSALRRLQATAAVLWIAYGVLIQSMPVIVSNVLVATVALISSLRRPPVAQPEQPS